MSEMFEVIAEGEAQLSADGAVTVEISHFCPASQRIQARDLRPGDRVFDAYGGTHYLESVRRHRGYVDTAREDGWEDRFHGSETLTIIREKEDYRDAL